MGWDAGSECVLDGNTSLQRLSLCFCFASFVSSLFCLMHDIRNEPLVLRWVLGKEDVSETWLAYLAASCNCSIYRWMTNERKGE